MRVISGTLKGRIIKGYNVLGTRPTMDRVKESIFGTIQNYVKDSVCLDLFAGSGNLGIEALSNGSKYCYFVDNNKEILKVLKDNINTFNLNDKCNISLLDYNKALEYFKDKELKFDLIFIDPPYLKNLIPEAMEIIDEKSMLDPDGLIVTKIDTSEEIFQGTRRIKLTRTKVYGNTTVCLYKMEDE